jgi:uncharacterized protein
MPPAAATPIPRPTRGGCLRRLLVIALGCYVGIVLVMVFFENTLVFPATTAAQVWVPPPSRDIEDVTLTSADGTTIHGWYLPGPGSSDALLYLHGNGGNLSYRGDILLKLRETLNASVLIIDYPGYGKSGGAPTEQGCYVAADAAYDWLLKDKGVDPRRLILFGKSLGGGVATHLASTRTHRALVLIKTYTSLPDVGAHLYPWLPSRWLMRNRFDSLSRIGLCRRPVFVAHGTDDELIPFALGRRLYDAANEPKEFFAMPGEDHNAPLSEALFAQMRAFLEKHPPEVS